jgi:hypothetical protein
MTINEISDTAAVIGYNPGFGNTQVCIAGRVSMIQSAISRPKSVGPTTIGMRAASQQVPIVGIGDAAFAVGPGSWNRREVRRGSTSSSISVVHSRRTRCSARLRRQAAGQKWVLRPTYCATLSPGTW